MQRLLFPRQEANEMETELFEMNVCTHIPGKRCRNIILPYTFIPDSYPVRDHIGLFIPDSKLELHWPKSQNLTSGGLASDAIRQWVRLLMSFVTHKVLSIVTRDLDLLCAHWKQRLIRLFSGCLHTRGIHVFMVRTCGNK